MKKIMVTGFVSLLSLFIVLAQPKKGVPPAKVGSAGIQASSLRGKEVYMKTCIACHQKDGSGVPRLNPPLIKTTYVNGDKTRLVGIILKGLREPITIDDEEYTNPMPAQPMLTDQQIADVLTFVRTNFGNKASAVTVAEVKAIRAKTK